MSGFDKLSAAELKEKLSDLKEELEEIEEERMLVLGQTGLHLPGGTVRKYEAEIVELKNKIEAVEEALQKKKS